MYRVDNSIAIRIICSPAGLTLISDCFSERFALISAESPNNWSDNDWIYRKRFTNIRLSAMPSMLLSMKTWKIDDKTWTISTIRIIVCVNLMMLCDVTAARANCDEREHMKFELVFALYKRRNQTYNRFWCHNSQKKQIIFIYSSPQCDSPTAFYIYFIVNITTSILSRSWIFHMRIHNETDHWLGADFVSLPFTSLAFPKADSPLNINDDIISCITLDEWSNVRMSDIFKSIRCLLFPQMLIIYL